MQAQLDKTFSSLRQSQNVVKSSLETQLARETHRLNELERRHTLLLLTVEKMITSHAAKYKLNLDQPYDALQFIPETILKSMR